MQLVTLNQKNWLKLNASSTPTPIAQGTIVTANKSATQAASVATDVPTLLADFNALLVKIKAAGIML